MCMYVDWIGSYVEILWECTSSRPNRFGEGLGGGCSDRILTRMTCRGYVYVCGLEVHMFKFVWTGLGSEPLGSEKVLVAIVWTRFSLG